MKKTYINPTIKVVQLNKAICESLIIGSGVSSKGKGNGTDLSRQDNSWDIWGTDADDELE